MARIMPKGMQHPSYKPRPDGLKWCYKCGQARRLEEFSIDRSRWDRRSYLCRWCRRIRSERPSRIDREAQALKGFRWCARCKDWKTRIVFSSMKSSYCRSCNLAIWKETYKRNVTYRESLRIRNRCRRLTTRPVPVKGRVRLLEEFEHKCAYCRIPFTDRNLSWDHIVAQSIGGRTKPWNVVPACLACNSSKHNHDLFEWAVHKGIVLDERILNRMNLEFCPLIDETVTLV